MNKDDLRETELLDRVIARVADRMESKPEKNLMVPVVVASAITTLFLVALVTNTEGAVMAVIEGLGE